MSEANEITKALLVRISEEFRGEVVAWRNNRLSAQVVGRDGRMRTMQAGLDGQADITGIMPKGQRLEIEVKAGRDRLSDKQVAIKTMIEKHGGTYLVARDVDGCLRELANRL